LPTADDYRLNDPAREFVTLAANKRRRAMKYICLGYIEPGKFQGMTEEAQHAMLDACFEYDDHLRANGHFAAGEALQPPENALTLYWKNGKVATVPLRSSICDRTDDTLDRSNTNKIWLSRKTYRDLYVCMANFAMEPYLWTL
jgi:hypothetical protein